MDCRWGQQKNLYFGCYLSKSKEFFYREMAILFPVKSEMAILFFVKHDPGPPLPPSLARKWKFIGHPRGMFLLNFIRDYW